MKKHLSQFPGTGPERTDKPVATWEVADSCWTGRKDLLCKNAVSGREWGMLVFSVFYFNLSHPVDLSECFLFEK